MPVRRSRAKAWRAKQLFLIFSIILISAAVLAGAQMLAKAYFSGGTRLAWRLKNIRITGESKDAAYEVSKYIGFEEGDVMTSRDAANLEAMLLANLRFLESASVKRNLLNKDLIIKIKKRAPAAKIIDGGRIVFMDKKGILFTDGELQNTPSLLPVYITAKTKSDFLPQELVELIKELSAFDAIAFESAALDMQTGVWNIKFNDGSRAVLRGFETPAGKLKALAAVYEAATGKKLKKPYDIDLNYYNYGKVYLKPIV